MVVDARPPNPPWIPLGDSKSNIAALSFYYSDPTSTLPVREVTKADDNKADPNFETQTYGLFSTCERGMRARAARDGMKYIFFCTNRAGVRMLTGYYRIGWFAKLPSVKGYSKTGSLDDYALAASNIHFISRGFPLSDLTGYLRGKRVDRRFRTFRYIDGEMADLLAKLLDSVEDDSAKYVDEVHRLEGVNLEKYGHAYKNWKRSKGFDWNAAVKYLGME